MEEEPKDVIILSAISNGAKKFDNIEKATKIFGQELNGILERLEKNGLVTLAEKKGFFGPKKDIILTEKGYRELEERKFELQKNWKQMVAVWKSGDKQKLQQYMDDNRSFIPAMMFLGIMDIIMFSTMLSFMGMAISSYMPESQMATDTDASTDAADSGTDMGDGSGFDIDIGF